MPDRSDQRTVAEVLRPYLGEQCRVVLTGDDRLRAGLLPADGPAGAEIDEDLVHDTRVALRRLRSILRIFAVMFSVPEAGRVSDDARAYAARLGAMRDLDILRSRVGTAIRQLDRDLVLDRAEQEFQLQLRDRRGIALADLESFLHHETAADLLDHLRRWEQQPPWSDDASRPASKIKKFLKQAQRGLDRRLDRAAAAITDGDPDTDTLIHSARKAGKRHRYAVEAAQPILGSSATKLVRSRRALQDQLGDYADSVLAGEFLRDLGGIPGRNGFTFGLLYAQEHRHRLRAREEIVKLAG